MENTTNKPHIDSSKTNLAPNPELEAQLKRYFGFSSFRPGQQQVVETILQGKSVLAVMPTGGGKSLCYQLPAMLMGGVTLVVSPLIALMKDQVDGLPESVQQYTTLVNSSLAPTEIDKRLEKIRQGKYKLVYAAPERLRHRPFLHTLRSAGISLVVVDEAHCVSMWGHDFRPDYLFIGDALRYLEYPTVLAMTATSTPDMRLEISNYFGKHLKIINTGTHRPNLFLESITVKNDEEKMRELIKLCREIDGPGIIYTRSRKKTEEISRFLRRERVYATYYHAGMSSDERVKTQEEFMDGRWRVICATVAFGMGIDKSDVRFVIHYSLPGSLEDYYQEAGRAGRDGYPSRCILMSTPSDKALVTRWMRESRLEIETPKKCYQLIRRLTEETPYAAVPADWFMNEIQDNEITIRVAISMLESVGLVKRHLDIPVVCNIKLKSNNAGDDPAFADFVEKAGIKPGMKYRFATMDLCLKTGIKPDEIEQKLLDWRDRGLLLYYGVNRVMLLEWLAAPRSSKNLLEDMLRRHARMQSAQADSMFSYAETYKCRHDAIAEHFGEPPIEGCLSCDNCVPQEQPHEHISKQVQPVEDNLTNDEKRQLVLDTVRMIQGQVGFTGLVRVLKGSIMSYIKKDRCKNFGIFASEPKATIERCVTELLDSGELVRDDSEYRLISLKDQF